MKSEFPVFSHHPDLIFLDSAASVQKPRCVMDAIREFSEDSYANIHRGGYNLSLQASDRFETARKNIANFLGSSPKQLVFTKNGTEASNHIAHLFQKFLKKDDEILISISEHHANILPWMRVSQNTGAKIIWVKPEKTLENFQIHHSDFKKNISEKTKIIVFSHVSNVTGQVFPVTKISRLAQEHSKKYSQKIFTVLDACQSTPHFPINFKELSVDALFFTGHKLGAGGTGGYLLSNETQETIEISSPKFSPFLLGGGIVEEVNESEFFLKNFPENSEAGTPSIENIIGLERACLFLKDSHYERHGKKIMQYALENFQKKLPNWHIVGEKIFNTSQRNGNRSAALSFYHKNIHHSDIGAYLSEKNIAVRTGFHCANPLHHFLSISGSVRASFWVYSEFSDIDTLITALQEIEMIMG